MTDTKVMHTCQCGFSWERGFSGQHACDPFYREKISVLEARVKELETAINQTIGWQESTDPMNAESVRLLVNVMQQKDGV